MTFLLWFFVLEKKKHCLSVSFRFYEFMICVNLEGTSVCSNISHFVVSLYVWFYEWLFFFFFRLYCIYKMLRFYWYFFLFAFGFYWLVWIRLGRFRYERQVAIIFYQFRVFKFYENNSKLHTITNFFMQKPVSSIDFLLISIWTILSYPGYICIFFHISKDAKSKISSITNKKK